MAACRVWAKVTNHERVSGGAPLCTTQKGVIFSNVRFLVFFAQNTKQPPGENRGKFGEALQIKGSCCPMHNARGIDKLSYFKSLAKMPAIAFTTYWCSSGYATTTTTPNHEKWWRFIPTAEGWCTGRESNCGTTRTLIQGAQLASFLFLTYAALNQQSDELEGSFKSQISDARGCRNCLLHAHHRDTGDTRRHTHTHMSVLIAERGKPGEGERRCGGWLAWKIKGAFLILWRGLGVKGWNTSAHKTRLLVTPRWDKPSLEHATTTWKMFKAIFLSYDDLRPPKWTNW